MIRIKEDRKNSYVYMQIERTPLIFQKGIKNALHEIGSENVFQLRRFIHLPPKSGRLYFFRGRIHRASAPGESPANMTGRLSRTTDYKVRMGGSPQVEFGDTAFYGEYLELGTRNMDPRPHVIRTVKKKERDNYNSLERSVKHEINRRS